MAPRQGHPSQRKASNDRQPAFGSYKKAQATGRRKGRSTVGGIQFITSNSGASQLSGAPQRANNDTVVFNQPQPVFKSPLS